MAYFMALPVGQGDAFYLETKAGSVLVDGGRSVQGFADLFRTYTQKDDVDVIIVTHNDADHTNGILGFLMSGLKCRELWLPGRWAQILPSILKPWEDVVRLILTQVEKVPTDKFKSENPLLEQYSEFISVEEQIKHKDAILVFDESGWPEEILSLFEHSSEEDESWSVPWWNWSDIIIFPYLIYMECPIRITLKEKSRYLIAEAIIAAKRIREIALSVYHRGIAVRWFEWNVQHPYGGYEWLSPLNCREIAQIKPIKDGVLLKALALTVSNRKSMVFCVPRFYAGGGVIFTADSDLKGVQLPELKGAIVTAPHHGSASNAHVYRFINQNTASVVWVRSDGKFRKRPCREFIMAKGRKFCTLCRNSHSSKQSVKLFERGSSWVRYQYVNPCSCI